MGLTARTLAPAGSTARFGRRCRRSAGTAGGAPARPAAFVPAMTIRVDRPISGRWQCRDRHFGKQKLLARNRLNFGHRRVPGPGPGLRSQPEQRHWPRKPACGTHSASSSTRRAQANLPARRSGSCRCVRGGQRAIVAFVVLHAAHRSSILRCRTRRRRRGRGRSHWRIVCPPRPGRSSGRRRRARRCRWAQTERTPPSGAPCCEPLDRMLADVSGRCARWTRWSRRNPCCGLPVQNHPKVPCPRHPRPLSFNARPLRHGAARRQRSRDDPTAR